MNESERKEHKQEISTLSLVIRDMPSSHKFDMINLLQTILETPTENPFSRSTLNHAYYVPRLYKVLKLLKSYGRMTEDLPYVASRRES